jgi:hypothetical protein
MERYYWRTPEFAALRKELGNHRLAGLIVRDGCKTFAEFCEKNDTLQMLRMPLFGGKSLDLLREHAAKCGIALREGIVNKPVRPEANAAETFDNDLFLHCSAAYPDTVMLAIGTRKNKRTRTLTADGALKLAYRLMSLAKGGETQGFERFDG